MSADLLCEYIGIHNVHHFLISPWEVGSSLLVNPFFPGHSCFALSVDCLLSCPESDSLIGTDDGCTDGFLNDDLLLRDVGPRSLKQPLVSRNPLFFTLILKIQDRPQPQRRVRRNDLQRGHNLFEDFPWVQREGLLGQTDLQISVAQLGLPTLVKQHFSIFVFDHWIFDDTVVPGGHCDHLFRAIHNPEKKNKEVID